MAISFREEDMFYVFTIQVNVKHVSPGVVEEGPLRPQNHYLKEPLIDAKYQISRL